MSRLKDLYKNEIMDNMIKKFGYKNEKIKSIELEKNVINYKVNWNIKTTNNIVLEFDAKGGKGLSIFADEILKRDIEGYHTTKQQAPPVRMGAEASITVVPFACLVGRLLKTPAPVAAESTTPPMAH